MNDLVLGVVFILTPYSLVVGLVYAICVFALKTFRAESRDGLTLLAPPLLYAGLDWWRDRQGLLFVHATLIVAIVVGLALPLKVAVRGRAALPLIVALGCIAAVLSWLLLPKTPNVMSDPWPMP